MRKLVIATTNSNKVERLRRLLADQNLEIVSLNDFDIDFEEPNESLENPRDIAAQKALYYASKLPQGSLILTQDDTLTFEGVDEADNPKNHIKTPVINKYGEFNDENAIKYYTELAKKYGGVIPASFRYGHALAIINDDSRNTLRLFSGKSARRIRLVDRVNNPEAARGYFLAAISECEVDGKRIFYNELTEEQSVDADKDLRQSILSLLKKIGVNV
jgi:hypothetical protein